MWVCFEGDTEYIRRCFKEYNVVTDPDGRYMCSYKKWHLIGLELGVSVAAVALRKEPTGVATGFNADVVATAKRNLQPGETLDGEGGYTVFGKLAQARSSLIHGYLPLGLAHEVKVVRPIPKDQPLTWKDVAVDRSLTAYKCPFGDGGVVRRAGRSRPHSTWPGERIMTILVTTPIPAPGMEILADAGPVDVLPAPPLRSGWRSRQPSPRSHPGTTASRSAARRRRVRVNDAS